MKTSGRSLPSWGLPAIDDGRSYDAQLTSMRMAAGVAEDAAATLTRCSRLLHGDLARCGPRAPPCVGL